MLLGIGCSFGYSIQSDSVESNNPPTAADNNSIFGFGSHQFSVSDFNYSDLDGDPMVSVKITALPSSGLLRLNGVDVTLNQIISVDDINAGLLVMSQGGNHSFQFSVNDGTDDSISSYTMTVNLAD